jgi:hypothetical protein
MSFVIATPELMQEAAQDLAGIRSSLAEATVNLADTTTGVTAAAQDEGPGTIVLSGRTFGGFLPGLLTFLPLQLAEAIGAPIPVAPVSM